MWNLQRNLDNSLFKNDLLNDILSKNVQTKHLDSFKTIAQYLFDRYAPLKEKHVRCNYVAFAKNLR